MKNLKTPLGFIGIAYFLYGLVMNIRMYLGEMWPTYLFFISMAIGLFFIAINKLTKRLPNYKVLQIVIGLLPITVFYIHTKVWNHHYPTTLLSSQEKSAIVTKYHNGDIIFQTSKSNQSKAIQLATHSKYSHMGIIYVNNGDYYVYEAVQPVKLTPLKKWIDRGENKHYVIKRLNNAEQVLTNSVMTKMKEVGESFKGKPYDIYFEWSDERIYCSELVWKMYEEATGIKIGELQSLSDFDLTNEAVLTKMEERYGDNIPMNEKVISPSAMFNSDELITIDEN